MTPIRFLKHALPLAALFALGSAPVHASIECGGACLELFNQANALAGQGKYQEALKTFRAAAQADPQASQPVSMTASLLLLLSARMKPDQASQVREMAHTEALRALQLAPGDPTALETLRLLEDAPTPLHKATPESARLLEQGEAEFAQRHYREALQKYEAAAQADPENSVAWVNAGDCYYVQEDYAQAEIRFRRATEIEPRNAQAWRFLSDALRVQKRNPEAEAALISGIAADPSQQPNWIKLSSLRAESGLPLKALALRRGVRVEPNQLGAFKVDVDSTAQQKNTPDLALRVALGVNEANLRGEDRTSGRARSPYAIELASWRVALKVIDEAQAKDGRGLSDPALLQMQTFARDGQLEPALLLLTFRQAYRPDLEAWEAAHPGGVKAFINRYGLRP